MQTPVLALALLLVAASAGCSGRGASDADTGGFTLLVADTASGIELGLKGAYLRGAAGWQPVIANGTELVFDGQGNATAEGDVPAGTYDSLRLLFSHVRRAGVPATMTQSGIEVSVNLTAAGGESVIALDIAWTESFFESPSGLAFTPVLARLVVATDGVETQRLEAAAIQSGSGKAPVARMRVFDDTGLEVFASTFVADSPENPVVGTAGNLTFSATGSEALQPGAALDSFTWDVGGVQLQGATVVWPAPIDGGNVTVRLTVRDTEGNEDGQVLALALWPGVLARTLEFTGTATGAGGSMGVQSHTFEVDTTQVDNATARLVRVRVELVPGSATLPVSDLDLTLDDGAAKRLGSQAGAGSQHVIDVDASESASGTWTVRVVPDPAYGASYIVRVTLTWTGLNPGIEAFLADYDDGHSHEH